MMTTCVIWRDAPVRDAGVAALARALAMAVSTMLGCRCVIVALRCTKAAGSSTSKLMLCCTCCSLSVTREVIFGGLSLRNRSQIVRIWTNHLTIAKHKPHHVELGIGMMNLVNDFIADLLVASIEQLRERWAWNSTDVGKRSSSDSHLLQEELDARNYVVHVTNNISSSTKN